jgi:hypothetical protein
MQVNEVKWTASETKRDVASAVERIGKVEAALGDLKGSVLSSLTRIESAIKTQSQVPQSTTPVAQLLISLSDAEAIRSGLPTFDPDAAYKGIGRLGDVLTDVKLNGFPEELIAKYPHLKPLRYVFDMKRPDSDCDCV